MQRWRGGRSDGLAEAGVWWQGAGVAGGHGYDAGGAGEGGGLRDAERCLGADRRIGQVGRLWRNRCALVCSCRRWRIR